MSTQEIGDFHKAKWALDMFYEINIPNDHIEAVRTKVARLIQDIEWAPFREDLIQQSQRLDEYRVKVSCKSLSELKKAAAAMPETLKQQLDKLQGTPSEIQQKVVRMLENQDWAPYHSRLQCLKLRLDALTKKKTLDDIDRVGISNLVSSITMPWLYLKELEVCPKLISLDLYNDSVKEMEEHIKDLPRLVFTRFSSNTDRTVLGFACAFDKVRSSELVKLMIRAGANVNGNIISNVFFNDVSPLCEVFASSTSDVKAQSEVMQLLLNAGANPNLVTRPAPSPFGFSTLIFDLIYMTDQNVDRLLPPLVDAGMNVDALQVSSQEDANAVTVVTPLMKAMMTGQSYYSTVIDEEEKTVSTFVSTRVNFIRALIFNNATVHEAARKTAEEYGLLDRLNQLVKIRDSVVNDLMTPVKVSLMQQLPLVVATVVLGYLTPSVPEMRRRCYAIEPAPVIQEEPVDQPSKRCIIC